MHIKPKKSLGQNFLIDRNIQKKIIGSCDLREEDIVLEIGAGKGDLTAQLAEKARMVFALEIDRRLFPELEEKICAYPNCRIVKADILRFDITGFLKDNNIKQKIKVVGNIPYYISSPIIERLVAYRASIDKAFLTVQKEFGRRVNAAAGSKEYGSFSCFVQYYAETRVIFEIRKGSFNPCPKVDSCFLSLEFRPTPPVQVSDERLLFRLIRSSFGQRRKTLRNSLSGWVDPDFLEAYLRGRGIDRNVRPERLSLSEFAQMSNCLAGRGVTAGD